MAQINILKTDNNDVVTPGFGVATLYVNELDELRMRTRTNDFPIASEGGIGVYFTDSVLISSESDYPLLESSPARTIFLINYSISDKTITFQDDCGIKFTSNGSISNSTIIANRLYIDAAEGDVGVLNNVTFTKNIY